MWQRVTDSRRRPCAERVRKRLRDNAPPMLQQAAASADDGELRALASCALSRSGTAHTKASRAVVDLVTVSPLLVDLRRGAYALVELMAGSNKAAAQ